MIKEHFIALAAVFLAGCAFEPGNGSSIQSAYPAAAAVDSSFLSIRATSSDELNSGGMEYDIEARVKTGNNPCVARGGAGFRTEFVWGRLHVIPTALRPLDQNDPRCAGQPTYPTQSEIIRFRIKGATEGRYRITDSVSFKYLGEMVPIGHFLYRAESLVHDVKIDVLEGGPEALDFLFRIRARIELGWNECESLQVERAGFRTVESDNGITLVAEREFKTPIGGLCRGYGAVYDPQFTTIEAEVRGNRTQAKWIGVRSVWGLGSSSYEMARDTSMWTRDIVNLDCTKNCIFQGRSD